MIGDLKICVVAILLPIKSLLDLDGLGGSPMSLDIATMGDKGINRTINSSSGDVHPFLVILGT